MFKDKKNKNKEKELKMEIDSDSLTIDEIQEIFEVPHEIESYVKILPLETEGKWEIIIYVSKEQSSKAEIKSPIRQLQITANQYNIKTIISAVTLEELNSIDVENKEEAKKAIANRTKIQKRAKDLFSSAAKQHASDIHISIEGKTAKVKYRVHGLLKEESQWNPLEADQFITTVYTTMCDVSDSYFNRTIPQNARISAREYLPNSVFGVRVATSQQTEGLYVVFRLLYQQSDMENLDIDQLGYTQYQINTIEKMKQKPTGINIIVGATGSGKSTTLQLVLTKIIKETFGQKNVITVEDPPEYPIKGAIQIPVANTRDESERKGKFNQAITAAMRLDPDIIMLGEIRDEASATLGLRAAMTGHQVWTTLHANSVFGALDRLIDYDISLDMLSDPMILTGIIYQTLVQKLCDGCKIPLSEIDLLDDKNKKIRLCISRLEHIAKEEGKGEVFSKNIHLRGNGCDKCAGGPPGISGRTVVAEILYPDEEILEMIRKNKKEDARKYWLTHLKGKPVSYQAGIISMEGNVDPVMAEDKVGFFYIDKN